VASASSAPNFSSASTAHAPVVAIVGATGAVGQEFLELLAERSFPLSELRLLASARSAGKTVQFQGETLKIQELTETSFEGVDLALFSAGGSITKKFGPIAVKAGAVVVDNSSAFRMTQGVPLIVPEVNPGDMAGVSFDQPGIIANPNCSTIIALTAVTPIHRAAGIKRMVVSTYQAASGAGAVAMEELLQQTREVVDPKGDGTAKTMDVFPFQYALNLFSHNSPMQGNGYNEEEMKMVNETRKMWGTDDVAITATCIRVPVMRAHAESINLTLDKPLSEAEVVELLANAPGVSLINDRESNRFPTPLDASRNDDVYAGRIRRDLSQAVDGDKCYGIDLFVCGDQIRKGAALNAVQIAEMLVAPVTA